MHTEVVAGHKHQRAIKVQHRHDRLHSSMKNSINQIIVMINGLLIYRSTRQDERQNASPRDTETVVFHPHSRKALYILLVVEVVLIGDIVLWAVGWCKLLKKAWRPSVKGNCAINLCSAAGYTEDEVVGKVVTVRRSEIIARRQDQLTTWNWSRTDGSRKDASRSLREILSTFLIMGKGI